MNEVRVWGDVLPGDEIAGGWRVVSRDGRSFKLTGTDERTGYPALDSAVRVVQRGDPGRIADMFAAGGLPLDYLGETQ